MIVDDLKNAILYLSTEGKLVKQKENEDAHLELIEILCEQKENKKYNYSNITDYPFDIPASWIWVRLEDICTKITDGTHSTPKYSTKGIPFLSVKDISSGKINFENTKFVEKDEHNKLYERCNPEFGDILITKVGTTGVPAIVDCYEEFSLFVSVALLKFNKNKIYNKLLYYFLLSPIVQKQVKDNTRGVGNKNWVLDAIKNTILPLPPLEEQKRIVDKIEELFAKLDEIKPIEEELKLIKNKFPNDMKKSILKHAIEGKLTIQNKNESSENLIKIAMEQKSNAVRKKESKITYKKEKIIPLKFDIPENWSKVCIGMISDISSGGTPARTNTAYWNGSIPWLKIGDLSGKNISSCSEYITEDGLKNSSAKWFEPGTILYTIFATIGNVGILNFRATTNQAIAGIKLFGNINKEYFYYVCLALKDVLISEGRGCAQLNINQEILSNVEIPIPPLEEQQRIVNKIEQLLPLCNDIEKLINE